MNQVQFADFVGVQKGTVSKWVRRGLVQFHADESVNVSQSVENLARYRREGLRGLKRAPYPPRVTVGRARLNALALAEDQWRGLDAMATLYGVALTPGTSAIAWEADKGEPAPFPDQRTTLLLLEDAMLAEQLGERPWD
jgi:hypothetical protein